MSAGQTVVGDDQIGQLVVIDEARQGLAFRFGGDDEASPPPQQSTHGVERERVVFDHDDELAARRIGHRLGRVLDRLPRRSDQRQRDRETRTSAERRGELEPVIEQTA